MERPVAILYEHPLWFEPLFAELDSRGISYERLHAERHAFDPAAQETPYSLVVNRMSPSASTRGHARAIFHTLDYLAYLDMIGAKTLNGHGPYAYELSKARQAALFAHLAVRHPRTRVVNDRAAAIDAARELRFPVLVKPNIGGSGAGIVSFDSVGELAAAELDFGLDGTALLQERIPAKGDSIVRVELLNGELLYAIRILLVPGSFNLCPADYCDLPGVGDGVSGRGAADRGVRPSGRRRRGREAHRRRRRHGCLRNRVCRRRARRRGVLLRPERAVELRRGRAERDRLRPVREPRRPDRRARVRRRGCGTARQSARRSRATRSARRHAGVPPGRSARPARSRRLARLRVRRAPRGSPARRGSRSHPRRRPRGSRPRGLRRPRSRTPSPRG